MTVTIERFDLLPSPPAAPAQASQAQGQQGSDGSAQQQPSRHDLLRALRLELARAARLRAY